MTVTAIERTMPAAEFDEWVAMEEIDPLPHFWWAAGRIIATILNVNRKAGSKAVGADDVFPFLKGPKPEKSRAGRDIKVSL
jgi:hypothetical protein